MAFGFVDSNPSQDPLSEAASLPSGYGERKNPGATSYLKNLAISPLLTKSIEWPTTGIPSVSYPLEAQVYLSQD